MRRSESLLGCPRNARHLDTVVGTAVTMAMGRENRSDKRA